ncbi:MAG: 16S rRNA (cytosine(1402)-N(4))-methyltransferase [Alphaproteobacteria bacterium]|nr:16S rRNA (cytosine(1402)-N(4))-methyltransferase [Alphaproteobacteria bacterium]
MTPASHVPVLQREVVDALQPRDGGRYVDGTFGAGGYSSAMLGRAGCEVIAIDRDPDAIAAGRPLAEHYAPRLRLIEGRFGDMAELLSAEGVGQVDGVALDLGVSSMQLDQAGRGFSFRASGPLDMRMERSGRSAADLVNEAKLNLVIRNGFAAMFYAPELGVGPLQQIIPQIQALGYTYVSPGSVP